jgi:N-acetyl-anhydromuramyl-L-alanine amidase AmpD
MGNKEIDKHSISIVLENMGMVFYDYDSGQYLNWVHEVCQEELIYEKNWKHCRYWEKYTDEQFDATVELCEYLCDKYKIPLDSLGFNVYHEDTSTFKGIVCRSNFDQTYNDLNPSFDFKKFLDYLDIKY